MTWEGSYPKAEKSYMRDKSFLDTNILVYAYDSSEKEKHPKASRLLKHLWSSRTGVLSIQVLSEFYVVVTQKVERPISSREAKAIIEDYLSSWEVIEPGRDTLLSSIEAANKYDLHFWDAMIFVAAKEANVIRIYTEDFQHNLEIEGMKFINPFR